jgi:hypothetical protein
MRFEPVVGLLQVPFPLGQTQTHHRRPDVTGVEAATCNIVYLSAGKEKSYHHIISYLAASSIYSIDLPSLLGDYQKADIASHICSHLPLNNLCCGFSFLSILICRCASS